jgi:hypothetical protein
MQNIFSSLYQKILLWVFKSIFVSFDWLQKTCKPILLIIIFSQCSQQPALPPGDADNGGLFLPAGFEALVVIDSTGRGRHIAVNDNGDIYVKLRFSKEGGSNVALRDTTGDGKADIFQTFGDYEDEGSLANGMRIHNGYLYYSSARVIYRNKLKPGQLIPDSEMEVVLRDDHEHGIHWHITKPVSFDKAGNMYVPFGTPSDACQDLEENPEGLPGSPGMDPCPELEQHGGIWKFKTNTLNMTQKDGEMFATGIRSVVAMDWNEADGNLYVVMHGRDNLHRLFPNIYSSWESAVLPSEEFLKVTEGSDFGWPYCYYDHMQEKKVLGPEYGGDGEIQGRCSDCDLPVMGFPFILGTNFLIDIKMEPLLPFMVPPIGHLIPRQGILWLLFLFRTEAPQVNMKFLPMDLPDRSLL